MQKIFLVVIAASLLLSACVAPSPKTTPTPKVDIPLMDTEWWLTNLTQDGKALMIDKSWVVTLVLMDQGNIGGKAACNQFGGKYTLKDAKLTTEEITQTLMACEPREMMDLESAYLKALSTGGTLKQQGDKLILTSDNGKTVLEFKRSQVSLPGSKWELTSLHDEMSASLTITPASVTLEFTTDGKVNGNGGCNNFFGSYKLDGSSLKFDPIGSTKKACAEDALNKQESNYFKALEATAAYTYRSGALQLLDAHGKILASFLPAQ